jgi:dipeptidyl aminopeptidase/acylaminoacyl peptidase
MNKRPFPQFHALIFTLAFSFCLFLSVHAQTLSVRQIMAEPSIAGQRVSGEKLSPDGSRVAFFWNAEGRMPRDLYLVDTTGGEPTRILETRSLPVPSPSPTPQNKLDYGLEIRDQFVRDRENQIGSVEWSPDSKRLIFTHGGDIYLLLPSSVTADLARERWEKVKTLLQRRADMMPELVQSASDAGLREKELFGQIADSRSALLNAMFSVAVGSKEDSSIEHRQQVLLAKDALDKLIDRTVELIQANPRLRSSDSFITVLDELAGNANRLSVALSDLDLVLPKLETRRLTITQAPEFGARFLDNNRIVYSQSGHVFVMHLDQPLIIQLTRESNPQRFISVGNVVASKDGNMAAYVVSDGSKQRQLVVPNFLPEYVTAGGPRRGWTEQRLMVMPTDGSRDAPHEIKLPKHEGVSSFRRMVWAADNRSLIVDRLDKDTKRRQLFYIYNVGGKDEKIILVTEETDEKWQAPKSAIFEPNPKDPAQLFFASERDGYNHLYLATLEAETRPVARVSDPGSTSEVLPEGSLPTPTVKTEQLTNGNWQVEWARWLAEGQIVYLSTERSYMEREFFLVDPRTRTRELFQTHGIGMKGSPQLSEADGEQRLVYDFSRWNQPSDIYAVRICKGCDFAATTAQLSDTVPQGFAERNWSVPKFIEIPSADGKRIPAKIYLPPGHNPTSRTRYPMVIFVHGAGYLQNVINGWNNYYREFMFNDMLAKKGYVVLDIDYRGSAGYGRDWRTDVYDFLGGKDYDDHIDSIDHMVKNYAVDQSRIGVYGGSYGGFMAGMLAMRAPERIAAAAALRPVFDWKNYFAANPFYTAQRLGFPDKNPEAYRRSSPIAYAEKLERPLLILHGMADDNVHVQDSVQLIEKLIRLGKTRHFEAMLYPSENHAFTRPESWADEYERILYFFEKHLTAK